MKIEGSRDIPDLVGGVGGRDWGRGDVVPEGGFIDRPERESGAEWQPPYSDEVVDGLWIGSELPGLVKKLNDPDAPEAERLEVSKEIARLYTNANKEGRWWYGPTRERPQERVRRWEPTPWREEPREEPEPAVEEPKLEEVELPAEPVDERNRFQRWLDGMKEAWRRGKAEYDEYLSRHHIESKVLAMIGGLGGTLSVAGGAVATEYMIHALDGGLLGIVAGAGAGIATTLALNNGVFIRGLMVPLIQKWGEKEKQMNRGVGGRTSEGFERQVDMDTKNRIRSVVIGDIEGKLISGVYFSSLVNRVHEAMRPEPQSAAPAEQAEPTYNYPPGTYGGHRGAPGTPPVPNSGELHQWPPATGTPEVTPVTPTPPLEGAVPAGWSEHIVTPRDILDNLLGERYVYSPQIIEWFKVNHGNMVSIWEKMASANPNHMVPIEMGPDAQIQYMTVEQVREKLDWLTAHGYQPGDAEAQAWVERLDKWLTPGSKIYLPPGVK